MTDWRARAAAADPPVPEEMLDQVIPTLEALESAFRPLVEELRDDETLWAGPQ